MNASIALQVLPNVTDREETRRIVDEVIAYIDSTGVKYVVGAFETSMEGDLDQLLDIVRKTQDIAIKAGAPSVASYVKISYEPTGAWSIEDRTGKYDRARLEGEGNQVSLKKNQEDADNNLEKKPNAGESRGANG